MLCWKWLAENIIKIILGFFQSVSSLSPLSHLVRKDRGVVDDAGDVDGAPDRDVEPGEAEDVGDGLADCEPDVLGYDGCGGDLALVLPAVLPAHGPDGEAPVRGVGGVAGLVPQVGGVGVAAHCQQVEAVLPQPGDRPVAQPVHPAVEAGGQSCQGRHLHVGIEQDPELNRCDSQIQVSNVPRVQEKQMRDMLTFVR